MSRNSILPGIERYPELEKKLKAKLAVARSRNCRKCDRNKIIARFRLLLEQRLKRDNPRRKS